MPQGLIIELEIAGALAIIGYALFLIRYAVDTIDGIRYNAPKNNIPPEKVEPPVKPLTMSLGRFDYGS